MRILRRAGVDLILYMLKNFTTLELREDDVLTMAGFWSMIVGGLELLMLANWDCENPLDMSVLMMELVKTHLFNLILHVRRVIQVQIDTSRLGVRCPDLIGNAGGQYMFFLLLFYWLRLSKVSQRGSNKSYLIKRLRQI